MYFFYYKHTQDGGTTMTNNTNHHDTCDLSTYTHVHVLQGNLNTTWDSRGSLSSARGS